MKIKNKRSEQKNKDAVMDNPEQLSKELLLVKTDHCSSRRQHWLIENNNMYFFLGIILILDNDVCNSVTQQCTFFDPKNLAKLKRLEA